MALTKILFLKKNRFIYQVHDMISVQSIVESTSTSVFQEKNKKKTDLSNFR